MSTEFLYPNGDVSIEWSRSSGSTSYTLIDETSSSSFRSPNSADTSDYIMAFSGGGYTDIYNFSTVTFALGNISSIKVWVYIGDDNNNGEIDISPEIYVNGSWNNDNGSAQISTTGTSGEWLSYTFTGNWLQNDIDSLMVKLSLSYSDFNVKCYGMYVEISYQAPSSPSIVRDCFSTYTAVISGTSFTDVDGTWTFTQKDSSNNTSSTVPSWYSGNATATHPNVIHNISGIWNLSLGVVGATKDLVFKNYLGGSAPMPALSGWTYSSSDNTAAEIAEGHGIGSGWTINLQQSNGPVTASGLLSWYRAHDLSHINADSSRVFYWYESSGRVNDFSQNTESLKPIYLTNQLGPLASIKTINASGTYMSCRNRISDARTVYLVMKHDTGSSADYQFFLGDSTSFDFHGNTGASLFDTGFTLNAVTNSTVYTNSVSTTAFAAQKPSGYKALSILTNGGAARFSTIAKDRSLGRSWDGAFAEIIAYSGVHDTNTRSSIENYLINKYSLLNNTSSSGNVPLYINGIQMSSSGLNLFINVPSGSSNSVGLYQYGFSSSSGTCDLYLNGIIPSSNSLDLFISGPIEYNNHLNLYSLSYDINTSNVPLYIAGPMHSSSGLNLMLQGPEPMTSNLNVFLNAGKIFNSSGYLPLSVTGSSSGWHYYFNNNNLFINGSPLNSYMNLFVTGGSGPTRTSNSNLNIYLHSAIPNKNNTLDLIINPITDFSTKYSQNELKLYIEGDGTSDGFIPSNSHMNLYMNTGLLSTSGINLFTRGYGSINDGIFMNTFGISGYLNQGMQLYTRAKAPESGNIPLFIRGFRN